jgi:ABC-2 type transport system permease protein
MNRVFIDLKASFKMFYRSKAAVFWTLAFPCILILLFGAIFSEMDAKYSLHVQNQDIDVNGNPSMGSIEFIEALNLTDAFNLYFLDSTVNATGYALEHELSYMLVIPKGFENDLGMAIVSGGAANATIEFIYDQSQSSAAAVIGILNSVINKMNQVLSGGADYILVQGETIAPKRFSFMDFFLPGMIAMSAMTTSIFSAVEISSRYRENGIFRKLATTPLRRIEWILSRTIHQIVISFIGMGVILGLGIALFDVKIIPDPLSLILVTTTSMLFSGIGMILSRFVKDPETAGAAANAITFPMMFLSGSFFPLEQMPEFLRTIATVLPLTYVNNGLRDTMIMGEPQRAIINTIIVAVLGVVCLLVGAWITKWEEE